ncbi:hypothetical protein AB0G04_42855 [Actinoplanes sp. NPDC023801]|uniref:hypothetical protein n=1 Tax=Actinoplanes sp. NPDC023801 TaxID=3154595 RepID=UPI0033D1D942
MTTLEGAAPPETPPEEMAGTPPIGSATPSTRTGPLLHPARTASPAIAATTTVAMRRIGLPSSREPSFSP